jgi:predicted transcriptional regulator
MAESSFLTNQARVLVCIAADSEVRLRDIAQTLGITERSVFAIVSDLTASGYIVKVKDGRRNRYQIQSDAALHHGVGQDRTVGEFLEVLVETSSR